MFLDVSGGPKGGLNSKLHAVCDGQGRPLIMLLSEGQMSDYGGALSCSKPYPTPKYCLQTRGMTLTGFETPLPTAKSPPAFHRGPTEKFRSRMILRCTESATKSKHVRKTQGLASHSHPI